MDYVIPIFLCVVVSCAVLQHMRLNERKKHLSQAYQRLDASLQFQRLAATRLCSTAQNVPNLHRLHALMKKMPAIKTLGLYGIDQNSDVYDKLHREAQCLITAQRTMLSPDFEISCQEFEEGHTELERNRKLYNQAALFYNDCQRNAVQDWFAARLGHQMAPPC